MTVPTRWRPPSAPPEWALHLGVPEKRASSSEGRVAALRSALLEGDLLADDLVHWLKEQPPGEGRFLFNQALQRRGGTAGSLPAPIRKFFGPLEDRPPWADRQILRLGSETMLRSAFCGSIALGGVSLVGGYLWGAQVKPLAMTGAFSRMAQRRAAETAQFVLDVASSPGLERDSAGFQTTLRVRVMHAEVRAWLRSSPGWRTAAWGLPINQYDMLATILQFSVGYLLGLRLLGVIVDDDERDAVICLWRYVGVLIGVREELLPATYQDAIDLFGLLSSTQQGPDDDSRELTRAFLRVPMEGKRDPVARGIGWAESRFLTAYVRRALGAGAARSLGVSATRWEHLVPVVRSLVLALEALRIAVPGGREIAVLLGRAYTSTRIRRSLGGVPAEFRAGHGVSRTAAGSS